MYERRCPYCCVPMVFAEAQDCFLLFQCPVCSFAAAFLVAEEKYDAWNEAPRERPLPDSRLAAGHKR